MPRCVASIQISRWLSQLSTKHTTLHKMLYLLRKLLLLNRQFNRYAVSRDFYDSVFAIIALLLVIVVLALVATTISPQIMIPFWVQMVEVYIMTNSPYRNVVVRVAALIMLMVLYVVVVNWFHKWFIATGARMALHEYHTFTGFNYELWDVNPAQGQGPPGAPRLDFSGDMRDPGRRQHATHMLIAECARLAYVKFGCVPQNEAQDLVRRKEIRGWLASNKSLRHTDARHIIDPAVLMSYVPSQTHVEYAAYAESHPYQYETDLANASASYRGRVAQ